MVAKRQLTPPSSADAAVADNADFAPGGTRAHRHWLGNADSPSPDATAVLRLHS
jgi:hypothetical protein